jgi:hypothetical protein
MNPYISSFSRTSSFFLTASAIVSRSLPLTLGILLHFFEDALASNLNTLLYPLALINLGLELGWLYSVQFNIFIGATYLLILVFKEGLISKLGMLTHG